MSRFADARTRLEGLLANATDAESFEKAANAALALTKANQADLHAVRLKSEILKLESDVAVAGRKRGRKGQGTTLVFVPLISTIVLAGTLILQFYTAVLSDQETRRTGPQRQELQRQREAGRGSAFGGRAQGLSQEYKQFFLRLIKYKFPDRSSLFRACATAAEQVLS